MRDVAESGNAVGEQDHRQNGWPRKSYPSRKCAWQPGSKNTESDTGLTTCRAGKELAQGYNVQIMHLIEPFATLDKLSAKITEVCDWSTEAGKSKPCEDA